MHHELKARYLEALQGLDPQLLGKERKLTDLSGLFLPSAPLELAQARQRVMVIGSETRAWINKAAFSNIEDYVDLAMSKHQDFFDKELNDSNDRGKSFHNFTRALSKVVDRRGLIYSNLFCFSWKGSSPLRTAPELLSIIQHYSKRLLDVQIDYFAPDTIIFANGMSSVAQRRAFFPISGPDQVCTDGKDYASQGIANRQLWEFRLYGHIRCFRIQHPSSRSPEAPKARRFLLNLLAKELDTSTPSPM
ncbi:hypothetical protein [Pseudomonas sp. 30_B]|uniref:hypothetical protein n=1 Tax=Pseudomonas sp. 30_B TaxID=2813575 RepID=UPI001A9EDB6B|nr:hypothetical protein [Pseudomonas sp. 30_B]